MSDSERFSAAIARFDAENARDPHGIELPYAQKLSAWVEKLAPNASEELRLAARCQHIRRWEIPRQSYPKTRVGYIQWREALKKFHAEKAGEILREVGYPDEIVTRVQQLNLKKLFPNDPDSRVLEDALCLVFLETQLEETLDKTGDDKMIEILRKTWRKMTPQAREVALKLPLSQRAKALVEKALAGFKE
jgi:hypothetical protein